ncbi:MAG: HDOD domain-containing protein [Bryobacteraceae bacterium]|jgi:EAL and modified HD-GYP domain-containing signal transduction protein
MRVATSREVERQAHRDAQTFPVQVFIARQPILDLNRRVYGYELLYRSGFYADPAETDVSAATTEVIANGLMTIGLARLVGNSFAFIGFDRDLLLSDAPLMLPARNVIVEILKTVEMDGAVVARCQELKKLGFQLAFANVAATNRVSPLAALADIVKVDFRQFGPAEQERVAADFSQLQTRLVADNVATEEEFERAHRLGYSYFQGYFFAVPTVVTGNRVSSQKSTYLQVFSELTHENLNYAQLERLFKHDPPMTYRLLRYLNSALFSWTSPIQSIRHALSLLGDDELRRWVGLLGLASLAEGRPGALIVTAMTRGRFCELLCCRTPLSGRSSELFLTGLLSLFDEVLQCPMEGVVEGLGLSTDVREALLGTGDDSSRLQRVLGLTLAWERGDWDTVMELSQSLDIDTVIVADDYTEAVSWSERMCDVAALNTSIHSV